MSFVPGILSKNWRLKLLATCVAILLWTVPRFEAQNTQVLEDIPVVVDLTDPRWALVGPPTPALVTVTVSGPARDLIALGLDRPPVYIPMAEVLRSDSTVPLRPAWFRASSRDGIVVEDLNPDFVALSFEPIEEHRLPLLAPVLGELPDSISLAGPPEITPVAATVIGPRSKFQGVDSLRLMPFDLSRLAGPGPFTQPVDTTGFPDLDILTREALVTFPTEPTAVREFPDQMVSLPELASDPQLSARPSSVTVVLSGPTSLVNAVRAESLRVTIPANQATLEPGQERQVVVVVEGVPDMVDYSVTELWVLLRRPVGQ